MIQQAIILHRNSIRRGTAWRNYDYFESLRTFRGVELIRSLTIDLDVDYPDFFAFGRDLDELERARRAIAVLELAETIHASEDLETAITQRDPFVGEKYHCMPDGVPFRLGLWDTTWPAGTPFLWVSDRHDSFPIGQAAAGLPKGIEVFEVPQVLTDLWTSKKQAAKKELAQ